MAHTIVLDTAYGYTSYIVDGLDANTIIDANAASWIVQNSSFTDPDAANSCSSGANPTNHYPIRITNSGDGLSWLGGIINGEVSLTSDWDYLFPCNSAAMFWNNSAGVVVDGMRVDRCWDGIRPEDAANNWVIKNCHITDARDDAISNHKRHAGLIENVLIDGCHVGVSLHDSSLLDGSFNEMVMDGLYVRSKMYTFKGGFTHNSTFKTTPGDPENHPRMRIRNCVFAIEDPNHPEQTRAETAWNITIESSNNYFLNLSDTPLPNTYPKTFGSLGGGEWVGFTVLEGQAARDHWNATVAGFSMTPEEGAVLSGVDGADLFTAAVELSGEPNPPGIARKVAPFILKAGGV